MRGREQKFQTCDRAGGGEPNQIERSDCCYGREYQTPSDARSRPGNLHGLRVLLSEGSD